MSYGELDDFEFTLSQKKSPPFKNSSTNSSKESLSSSPSKLKTKFSSFGKWFLPKGETINSSRSSSSSSELGNRKEVRSVFGWTDVPSKEEQEAEEKQLSRILTLSQELKNEKITYSKQDELPRLPVPDLKATCTKYLNSVEPLLTSEEFQNTKNAVEEFLKPGGDGEKLQAKLIERSLSSVPSWLEEWWDDSYLYGRDPISINVNYFFGFEDDPDPQKNNQIGKAASLLYGAIIFRNLIRDEKLSIDLERNAPLCMSQYPRVFGASRIPGETRDSIITYTKYKPAGFSTYSRTTEYIEADPTHVVVICNNQFYSFNMYNDGRMISLSETESYLNYISETANNTPDSLPVGVFTTQDRSYWARMREKLIEAGNKDILEKIQSALIVVCLDSITPSSLDEVSRLLLHGPGSNRWFDKHQLIVCQNGKAGICFEHSVGDGATTLRLADEMYKYSISKGNTNYSNDQPPFLPEKLVWKLTPEIEREIESSFESFKKEILANETSTLNFTNYGGQFIKTNNMSPDAYVQLAIQLTYFRMFGTFGATYEAASTRQFLHGRTETVRSVSKESIYFCESTVNPLMKREKVNQFQLLKQATEFHVRYMRDAKLGKGVDRHLFGLRMLYEQFGDELGITKKPPIFQDKGYSVSGYWKISTSHCGSSSLNLFGFGPVVVDGFGVGYMIKNNSMCFNITSKFSYPESSSSIFATILESSLLYLKAVTLSNPELFGLPSNSLDFTHPTNSIKIRSSFELSRFSEKKK